MKHFFKFHNALMLIICSSWTDAAAQLCVLFNHMCTLILARGLLGLLSYRHSLYLKVSREDAGMKCEERDWGMQQRSPSASNQLL